MDNLGIVIVIVILAAGYWLYCDTNRNKPIYHDTDESMARIEERINSIESRLGTMQKRLDESQKTLNGISERVEHSTNLANEIAGGIGSAEKRLDDALQRSGRIENLIQDIERTNQ